MKVVLSAGKIATTVKEIRGCGVGGFYRGASCAQMDANGSTNSGLWREIKDRMSPLGIKFVGSLREIYSIKLKINYLNGFFG